MTNFGRKFLDRFRKKEPSDTGRTAAPQDSGEPIPSPAVEPPETNHTKRLVFMVAVSIAVILMAASGLIGAYRPGPEQPVPFSHHLHANNKQINCLFCHPCAPVSRNAGIPPVEKCMLCHKVIASNFKPIQNLKNYYDRKEPVPWVRVAVIPDHVHFSHQNHIARGVDCSRCHGDVRSMDRLILAHKLDMNFCVQCHWKNNVTTSCVLCHY